MKKIINGKKYNTETATEIAAWSNNVSTSDFGYCYEALYLKRTGEYFLFGEGGPMSKYAESCGDCIGWGESIIPLSVSAAKRWAERRLDGDEYERIFGDVEE